MKTEDNNLNSVLVTSKRIDWGTPRWLFRELDHEFHFDVDVCANDHNHKCATYFTPEQDGLKQDWSRFNTAFMNPPYGRHITQWVRKAYQESLNGCTVVCLLPARTDTSWWHNYCLKGDIRFLRGRVDFDGAPNSRAPFPSAIVIFKPKSPEFKK